MPRDKKYRMIKEPEKKLKTEAEPDHMNVLSVKVDRRSFLKTAGFSMAAVMAACSKTPVEKAIPFLIQPEEIVPGKAYWYASTSHACPSCCAVLIKNRDGRPIKVEGNPEHPLTQGGVCAVCQAGIIELYDSKRLVHVLKNGEKITLQQADNGIIKGLRKAREKGQDIVLLTGSITSPSTQYYINKFQKKYKNAIHFSYDPVSYSAILDAHQINYGTRLLPGYKFNKADFVLSLDADFLGTWLSPTQFTKDYRKNRNIKNKSISRHIQVESRLSVTGSKADQRMLMTPSEIETLAREIEAALSGGKGHGPGAALARELEQHKGKSLVISGINDLDLQIIINRINQKLGNLGRTIDLKKPSRQYAGNDGNILELLERMSNGKVGVLLAAGVNPVYDFSAGEEFKSLLEKVPVSVSTCGIMDETASVCTYVVPEPHYFQTWSDNELTTGLLSMTQPALQMPAETRTSRGTIAAWAGVVQNELDLVRNYWKKIYKGRKKGTETFNRWWDELVHDGFKSIQYKENNIVFKKGKTGPAKTQAGLTLVAYQTLQMLDGRHAQNPWLQEMPDPINKITWDNAASLSPGKATELNLLQGDLINIKTGGREVELPVYIQEGQHEQIISVALGYGRLGTQRFHDLGPKWLQGQPTVKKGQVLGKKITQLLTIRNKAVAYSGHEVVLTKTGKTYDLALTQTYNTLKNPENTSPAVMETRPFVQETTFTEYKNDPSAGSHRVHSVENLWKEDHPFKNHHWAMAIDLSACTGCSACVISCQVENNIPVVGKDEVLRRRELHWMRIDRYYSGEGENIDVAHQPMLCQHCDNSPCEPVCPVLATVHSSEGLNQQIYNRCVGTRFCANNCPYKVRRFNWFDYAHEDELENMVLNPDVTVRSRGVMEKCTFCVQRIQEAKIEAKAQGVELKDGDIKLACEQSCPADAIVFGDLNDSESRISKLTHDPRLYHVLEELNVRPSIGYMTLIRNRDSREKGHG